MKKFLSFLVISLLLSACNDESNWDSLRIEKPLTVPTEFKAETEDFLYELKVNKGSFSRGKKVKITASLTYIGDGEEVTISHAASPFYFDIQEETRGFLIDYPMDQPSMSSVLQKGRPLKITYQPSGGYSDQDSEEYVAFMDALLSGDYPSGYYTVMGSARFSVVGESFERNMKGLIGFEVK